ncbi:FGGY-family carbohydrate kinase [Oceanobacillus jeddahense]|uniref:FGGY-family carbohydrate kinase n=1 Tax=Oceanobacillus jeddahense TaxID=1462527 RepID=UPI00059594EA|nr:FGGY-family carbohydrate kinase [Oceanobacillus jeddahense]
MYLIGIDAGNTSIKTNLFDTKGKVIASYATSSMRLRPRGKGFEEFDIDALGDSTYESIRETLKQANVDPAEVKGVGITSFGNGLVVLDKDGNTIAPGAFSQDYRATDIVEQMTANGTTAKVAEITKATLFAGQPGPILRWFKDNEPHVYSQIGTILMFKDYLVYKLTDTFAADANNFGGSNLLDLETFDYSKELMDLFGIPEMYDVLPKLARKPEEIIGEVTEEAAEKTGLLAGTPVVAGMMDVFASLIGAGATDDGTFTAVAGTWSINLAHTSKIVDGASGHMPYLNSEEYLVGSWSGASGANYEWFTRILGGNAKIEAHERGISYYEVLDELIDLVPIERAKVIYHPFVAQPSLHTEAKANFFNVDQNTTYAEFAYAVAEGVAFVHKYHIDFLRNAGVKADKIRLTGGIARSKVWAQIFANVLELPIEVVEAEEVGALGAAIVAGVATEVYDSYEDAFRNAVTVLPAVNPDTSTYPIYESRYKEWYTLTEIMKLYWNKKRDNEI